MIDRNSPEEHAFLYLSFVELETPQAPHVALDTRGHSIAPGRSALNFIVFTHGSLL